MSPRLKAAVPLAIALAATTPSAAHAMLVDPPLHAVHSSQPPARIVSTPAAHGFDWGDAGIGVIAGVGLSALAAGGSLVVVARRRARHYVPAGRVHA